MQPAYGQAPPAAPPAAPLPGYGPAQPGAFAGGNSRTPSVAPGSYVAPASQPPVPAAHGPTPGGPAKTIMGAAAPVLAPPPHADPRARAPSQPNFAPPAMPPPMAPPGVPPGSNPSMPAYGMPPADPRTRSPSQPNLPAYGMPPQGPGIPGSNPSMPAYGAPPPAYGAPPQPYGAPPPGQPGYGAPPAPYGAPQPPVPAQPFGAPQGYGAPQGAPPPGYAQPQPGGAKSKKGLFLALGGVVAVGAIIAIVVVATSGGGGGGGGVGSRDELAKQAVAAVVAGDVDELLSLAGPEDLQAQLSDCKADDPDNDPAKAREKAREAFVQRVEAAKGLKAEVLEVSDASSTKLEKGKEVGTCTMKTDVTLVTVNAKLKVAQGDKPGVEQPAQMMFLNANERWYLVLAPEIHAGPDCAGAVAKHLAASKELLAKLELSAAAVGRIEKKMVGRCVDDSWPDDAIECFSTATGAENEKCTRKLSTTQREKVEADINAILEQEQKARGTTEAPPDPTPTPTDDPPPPEPEDKPQTAEDPLPPEEPSNATPDGDGDVDALPSVCDDWRAQLAKLKSCTNVPEATRRGMQDSYDILESTWKRLKTRNNAMRESMARSCKAGLDGVFEVRKAFCR